MVRALACLHCGRSQRQRHNSCSYTNSSHFIHGLIAVAHGKVGATDFPKVKLFQGNFHGYVKKNKGITHDSFRGIKVIRPVNKNPKQLNQSPESEMCQRVKITCCSRERVEFVLAPNPARN